MLLLYIEDDATDAHLLKQAMLDIPGAHVEWVARLADLESALASSKPALILLDFRMEGGTTTKLIPRLAQVCPVVMLSGSAGGAHIRECIEAGAASFLHKDVLMSCPAQVFTTLSVVLMKTKSEAASGCP